jgi:hypothetical protein
MRFATGWSSGRGGGARRCRPAVPPEPAVIDLRLLDNLVMAAAYAGRRPPPQFPRIGRGGGQLREVDAHHRLRL